MSVSVPGSNESKEKWTIGVTSGVRERASKQELTFFLFHSFLVEREQIVMAKESWEEEEVADSWDAEEEEEQPMPAKAAVESKPVKETKQRGEVQAPAQTATESAAERKERLERAVKESDLENAMALFGISKGEVDVDEVLEVKKVTTKGKRRMVIEERKKERNNLLITLITLINLITQITPFTSIYSFLSIHLIYPSPSFHSGSTSSANHRPYSTTISLRLGQSPVLERL